MKHAKRIGALICVIAICFTLMAAPSAHAVGLLSGQQFGAWISAGLVAANILWSVTPFASGPQNLQQWLSDPFMSEESYSYPPSALQNYLNAATIKVDQGVTTIDGVVYDELWVEPGEFMTGLKTNLFDFKTKFNILSGQSDITLVTGSGYLNGEPMYNVDGTIRTPKIVGEGSFGGYSVSFPEVNNRVHASVGDWTSSNSLPRGYVYDNHYFAYSNSDSSTRIRWTGFSGDTSFTQGSVISGLSFNYLNEPFSFGYTSGIVPADISDIPDDYGLQIRIPHDKLQTFYSTYPQYNVDNSVINIQESQIDIDELTRTIFDLVESVEDLKVEFASEPEPEPEPEPPAPVEDVIEGLNVIAQQQFEQMQQQTQIQQQQQQMQQQQLQEQQQISQNTSEINETIKDVTATPDAEELPSFKFDLRELFPFCIPFDIYRLLSSFDAEPQAPHVQIPIVIDSINFRYNLDLDFSAWDPVAQAMRTAELIVYAIALAWATGKVIKW